MNRTFLITCMIGVCVAMVDGAAVAMNPQFEELVGQVSEVSRLAGEARRLRNLALECSVDPSWAQTVVELNGEAHMYNMAALGLGQEIRVSYPATWINLAHQAVRAYPCTRERSAPAVGDNIISPRSAARMGIQ